MRHARRSERLLGVNGALFLIAAAWMPMAAQASHSVSWDATDGPVTPLSAGAASSVEPTVALDPTDPSHVIVGAIEFPGDGTWGLSIHTSGDGGRTWVDRGHATLIGSDGRLCPSSVGADPSITFGESGATFSYLSYAGTEPGCEESVVAVARSTDGGATWSEPVVATAQENGPQRCSVPDKDVIGSDPRNSTLYLTWTRLTYDCRSSLLYSGSPIMMSRSTDGGATWSPPILVSQSADEVAHASTPRVGPDGTLYVGYSREATFADCPAETYTIERRKPVSAEAVVAVSHDGGITWAHHVVGAICDNRSATPEQPFGKQFSLPALSVDPKTGLAVLAWSSRDLPLSTVHVTSSADGGVTWTSPVAVSDLGRSAFMPAVVAAGGAIHLTYISQSPPTGSYDVAYRSSHDGITWSAPTVMNSIASCVCYSQLNGTGDIADYMGLDATEGSIVAVWPDDRDPRGVQAIYARAGAYS